MTDDLTLAIRKAATEWAKKITRLAHQNLGDKKKLILVKSTTEVREGKVVIESTANPKLVDKYGRVKDVARAYEYGSGVHSRRSKKSPKQIGIKGKILIKPVATKILAFKWDVADTSPRYFIFGKDGKVLLTKVEHPGVKAANEGKGYLAPAINDVRKQIRKEIPKETRDAIIGTIRKSFKK